MKILVACEYSGVVRDAFKSRGHNAWSCDLDPANRPGKHILCDVLEVLDEGWDMMIAHPDCTYLTNSAEWAYGPGPYHQRVKQETLVGEARQQARRMAIDFVKRLLEAPIQKIAIENPVGVLSREIGKPSQIVQPHQFGEDASKATCLWLKGLPLLQGTKDYPPRIVTTKDGKEVRRWSNQTDSGQNRLSPSERRGKDRALTYQGIADAMASQWG